MGYLTAFIDDFAVVIVPVSTIESPPARDAVMREVRRCVRCEVVLAAPTREARIQFHGRSELARMAVRTPLDRVEWRTIDLVC